MGKEQATETAKFASMIDKFFDCLNVSNFTAGHHSRNAFKYPYWSPKDFRLQVLFYVLCDMHYIDMYLYILVYINDICMDQYITISYNCLCSGSKMYFWSTWLSGRKVSKNGSVLQLCRNERCC